MVCDVRKGGDALPRLPHVRGAPLDRRVRHQVRERSFRLLPAAEPRGRPACRHLLSACAQRVRLLCASGRAQGLTVADNARGAADVLLRRAARLGEDRGRRAECSEGHERQEARVDQLVAQGRQPQAQVGLWRHAAAAAVLIVPAHSIDGIIIEQRRRQLVVVVVSSDVRPGQGHRAQAHLQRARPEQVSLLHERRGAHQEGHARVLPLDRHAAHRDVRPEREHRTALDRHAQPQSRLLERSQWRAQSLQAHRTATTGSIDTRRRRRRRRRRWQRGATWRARHIRSTRLHGLLERAGQDERVVRRSRLAAHGRLGPHRPRRLHLHHRSPQGAHHYRRWREYRARAHRGHFQERTRTTRQQLHARGRQAQVPRHARHSQGWLVGWLVDSGSM